MSNNRPTKLNLQMFQKALIFLICLFVLGSCTKKDPVQYELSTSVLPIDGGTVTPPSGLYKEGESVVLTATPSAEYLFTGWSNGGTGTANPLTIVMSTKKSITANFEKRKYPLTLNVVGDGIVQEEVVNTKSVSNYSSGTLVKLTAQPNKESLFVGWSGDYIGSDNSLVITIDKAKTLTATFEKIKYLVTVTIDGDGTVSEEVVKT